MNVFTPLIPRDHHYVVSPPRIEIILVYGFIIDQFDVDLATLNGYLYADYPSYLLKTLD